MLISNFMIHQNRINLFIAANNTPPEWASERGQRLPGF